MMSRSERTVLRTHPLAIIIEEEEEEKLVENSSLLLLPFLNNNMNAFSSVRR